MTAVAGALPWVITDARGDVLEASATASALFNVSLKAMRQRSLYSFFDGDRDVWINTAAEMRPDAPVERSSTMRPRERRPMTVAVRLTRETNSPASNLVWVFELLSVAPRRRGRSAKMDRSAKGAGADNAE
jgi:hypothetical protein